MEAEKLNNGNRKSGSCEAGFFYRRIGGTVYKIRVLTSENSTDTFSDKIWSLKNKEWYVDGKAPLNLGYDAIRLRVDLVIPRVSAFGDIALTQVLHNILPTIQKMDRWSFFICIGSEESGTLPIEPQTPSVIISLLIKIWRLGRYKI